MSTRTSRPARTPSSTSTSASSPSTITAGRPSRPRAGKARRAAISPAAAAAVAEAVAAPSVEPSPAGGNAPPRAPATHVETGEIARLQATLAAHRQALVERQANQEAIENGERARAKSPVAYIMEVVSCRWAVETWSDETAPRYAFPSRKCYQGKETPDQDCRECQYVKLLRYGNLPHLADERRYHDHGMVIPIPDEHTALALAEAATKLNLRPLRRVQHEIESLERKVVYLESELAAAHRRALEAAQGARQ